MHELLALWGKTAAGGSYHPALYHMLDVGNVARALMNDAASPRIRAALRHAWRGANEEALLAWIPFLVALHDIGKISAPFQAQQTNGATNRQYARLVAAGFPLPSGKPAVAIPHSAISAYFLDQMYEKQGVLLHRDAFRAICDAIGGHHGRYVREIGRVGEDLALVQEYAEWHTLRRQAFAIVHEQLAPTGISLEEIGKPRAVRSATIALTGMIILSDWIGSDTTFFPLCNQSDIIAYQRDSAQRARDAVKQVGFAAQRTPAAYTTVENFFKHFERISVIRPLQHAVDALEPADLQTPALYIIEAPTGEGKTEAALALARRLAALGASDEVFFALPTMATSNQMYTRLSKFFDALYGKNGAVKLSHGQATLVEDDLQRLALLKPHEDSDIEQEHWADSGEKALEWFGSSKRALLAPFGVGTVDQVELAGLHTRYYMLKLWSLAGKIVIVDEVHAYDTYMNTILEHTLQWLAALGTTVILLSATLPTQRHAALARTYVEGLGGAFVPQPPSPHGVPYPLLSIYSAHQQRQIVLKAFRAEQRLQMRFIHDEGYEAQAQRLLDLVADGGAVARICNRVDDAQCIFEALQQCADLTKLVLIHARFPLEDRQKLEQQIDKFVGRKTQRSASDRIIIVGTQVLEQSLDYDVDVMVTDLAPIDLLLQRAGRLHRHIEDRPANKRPPRHQQAMMYVQFTGGAHDVPDVTPWNRIYAPYVLWRTWETLTEMAFDDLITIELPQHYRTLIEAVYRDTPVLAGDAAHKERMQQAWDLMTKAENNMHGEAKLRLTPSALKRGGITRGDQLEFKEDEEGAISGWQAAKTRLGDRITVVPVYETNHGWSTDAEGTQRLGKTPPDLKQQIAMLGRSFSLSNGRLVDAIRNARTWEWKKPPAMLKHVYPLPLQSDGRQTIAGVPVRLDPVLGFVIDKENV